MSSLLQALENCQFNQLNKVQLVIFEAILMRGERTHSMKCSQIVYECELLINIWNN